MRRGHSGRVDANQDAIIAALRKIGAAVVLTCDVGGGFPDLIVGFQGRNYLVEVKNPENRYGRKGLSESQRRFAATWPTGILVVTSPEEAVRVVVEAGRPNA